MPDTHSVIEALLFVGGPPLTVEKLHEILDEVDGEGFVGAVAQLNQLFYRQRRPYELRRVGTGYQMQLRPEFAGIVRRVYSESREVRLSQAAVEVLALVAYRQPLTSQEVDAARGTDCAAILRQLRRRNLITVVDPSQTAGRTAQYATTRRFLELFHLSSLDDLPRVQELEKP